MTGFDRGPALADRFRAHAGDQTHLYGYAMRGLADDLEAGGPTRDVVRGYEDAPVGSVIQLRLLAGIFRLVLTHRAPELEPYYPCLGGIAPAAEAWPVMRDVVAAHVPELHDALAIAPQTNEVGRSVALLVGLADVAAASGCRRFRVLELGASAGLNQLLARFRITGQDWAWGPADSPVQLPDAVEGSLHLPAGIEIVAGRGCDLDPVDPTTPEGRLRLTSFVWPFDLHRHERLAGALELAAVEPPVVDRASAADWLGQQLAGEPDADPDSGVLTLVWHSVTQLYWPASELATVEARLSAYGREHPLAEVGMEYPSQGGTSGERPDLTTRFWAGDDSPPRERRVGIAHDHGVPVRLS
ncbi:MAG: DUF2332 domain-containing protein [Microlunatus sp.]